MTGTLVSENRIEHKSERSGTRRRALFFVALLAAGAVHAASATSYASPRGNPAAYARGDGYSSVMHRSTDNHLHEIYRYQTSTGPWGWGDLFKVGGAIPPAVAGRVSATWVLGAGYFVVYRDIAGDLICYNLVSGAGWSWSLLQAETTGYAPPADGDPVVIAFDGGQVFFYRAGGDIWQLTTGEQGLLVPTNLTALTGAATAAGEPSAYSRSDGYFSVVYRGTDNNIYELYMKNSIWGHGNLTSKAGVPGLAAGDPSGYVRHDGFNAVVFRAKTNGHIMELWLGGSGWSAGDLSSFSLSTPPAVGNPVGYIRADGTNAVVFRSNTNDIIELALVGGTWVEGDLTSCCGNSWLGIAVDDPAAYVRADNVSAVVFRDANNHVRELRLNSTWIATDLTVNASETP